MQKTIISQNDKLQVIEAVRDLRQLELITIQDKNNIMKMLKDNDSRNINLFARRLLDTEQECYNSIIKNLLI